MNIEDTGSRFVFDDGNFSYHFQYGHLTVMVTGSSLIFRNRFTSSEELSALYNDISLVGIDGVLNATELAEYLMDKT